MFGFPAFYAAGKLVACVYGTGLGLRLPPEEAAELRGRTSRTFEPYGRTMRAWTFLEPVAPEELRCVPAVGYFVLDIATDCAGCHGRLGLELSTTFDDQHPPAGTRQRMEVLMTLSGDKART